MSRRGVSDSPPDIAALSPESLRILVERLLEENAGLRAEIARLGDALPPEVEIIVHVDSGATFVAKEHREHFKSAIDLIVEKMERQLKKDNEKRKHHKGVEGAKGPDPNEPPPKPEETFDDAVRRRNRARGASAKRRSPP